MNVEGGADALKTVCSSRRFCTPPVLQRPGISPAAISRNLLLLRVETHSCELSSHKHPKIRCYEPSLHVEHVRRLPAPQQQFILPRPTAAPVADGPLARAPSATASIHLKKLAERHPAIAQCHWAAAAWPLSLLHPLAYPPEISGPGHTRHAAQAASQQRCLPSVCVCCCDARAVSVSVVLSRELYLGAWQCAPY